MDYSSKCIDLRNGLLAGLLTGLASLNCSELTLKELHVENVPGLHRLLAQVVAVWTEDIRNNQIPRLLVGVGPMHSIFQLLQGVRDLIVLPLEQYQKDGRLVRGLQRGASSFTTSTALSLLEITHKLLGAVKFFAEVAFDIMSPDGHVVQGRLPYQHEHRRRQVGGRVAVAQRPSDLREGVVSAYEVMKLGMEETSSALQEAIAREQHRGRGLSGMVGGVLREVQFAIASTVQSTRTLDKLPFSVVFNLQVPSAIVRPVIYATEATANVIEGVQGTVAPEIRKEEEDKWKRPSHLSDY